MIASVRFGYAQRPKWGIIGSFRLRSTTEVGYYWFVSATLNDRSGVLLVRFGYAQRPKWGIIGSFRLRSTTEVWGYPYSYTLAAYVVRSLSGAEVTLLGFAFDCFVSFRLRSTTEVGYYWFVSAMLNDRSGVLSVRFGYAQRPKWGLIGSFRLRSTTEGRYYWFVSATLNDRRAVLLVRFGYAQRPKLGLPITRIPLRLT